MHFAALIAGFTFFLPVLPLIFDAGLENKTLIGVIFSVMALSTVLLEIPTGYLSDRFGRKKNMLISYVFKFASHACLLFFNLYAYLLFAVLAALTRTLRSGTIEAYIFEKLRDAGKENEYKHHIGINYATWPLGASVASIIGGYLANIDLSLTIIVTLFFNAIAIVPILFIKEAKNQEHKDEKGFYVNKYLIFLFAISVVFFGISEAFHNVRALFFTEIGLSLESLGWISAMIFGFTAIGYKLSHRFSERFGDLPSLLILAVATPVLFFLSTFPGGMLAGFVYSTVSFSYGLWAPIMSHLINLHCPERFRATTHSIQSLLNQLSVAVLVTPLVGLSEIISYTLAYRISALFILTNVILILVLMRLEKK